MQALDLMRRMSIMQTIESTFEKFIDEKRTDSALIEDNEQQQQKENKEKESMRKKSSASKLFFDLPGANAA